MKRWTLIIIFLAVGISASGQKEKVLKGVSQFRKALFESDAVLLAQNEEIRMRLDTLGVDSTEYIRFLYSLFFVSRKVNTIENSSYQYIVNSLKTHRIYKHLSEKEIAILLDSYHLLFFPNTGIWGYRYPHKIDPNAFRVSEIVNYGIKEGDTILHYGFAQRCNGLCPILYFGYDRLHIVHSPSKFNVKEKRLFDVMVDSLQVSKTLKYPPNSLANLDESQKYDIIVFDGVGFLTYRIRDGFKFKFKQISRLLKDDGVLIMGANATDPPFDGPFDMVAKVDVELEDVYKLGFELIEKIFIKDEFVVYKLKKKD